MSKMFSCMLAGGSSFAAGSTNFVEMGTCTGSGGDATEAFRQLKIRTAGTYTQLYVRILTNGTTTNSTITFRKNGANGNQVIIVTAGVTGDFKNVGLSDTVAAADLINTSWVIGATAALTASAMSAIFTPSDGTTVSVMAGVGGPNFTSFGSLSTIVFVASPESISQASVDMNCTLKNLGIYVSANTRDGTCVTVSRIAGVNGNVTVSVTASTTGWFEDTSNSDTITSGQLVCLGTTLNGTTGTVTVKVYKSELVSTENKFMFSAGDNPSVNKNLTRWKGLSYQSNYTATEANVHVKTYIPFTASKMDVQVNSNGVSDVSTQTLQKNGSDTAVVVSITASTTGHFRDTTNSVAFAPGDSIYYKLVTGTTGTNLNSKMTSLACLSTGLPAQKSLRLNQAVNRASTY